MENFSDQSEPSKQPEDKFQALSTNETTNSSLSRPNDLLSPNRDRKFLKFSAELLKEKLQFLDSTNETSELTKAQQVIPESLEPPLQEDLSNTLLIWLRKLELEDLYETLIQNGYDDLSFLIEQMKTEPLNEEILEKIGVRKLGHRKILLAFLEEEAEKYFRRSFPVKSSCCSDGDRQDTAKLVDWLDALYLKNLHGLFIYHGFCDLRHLLFLMNSSYPVTDEVLREIGISKIGHRQRILFKLREDSKQFSKQTFYTDYELNSAFIACSKCVVI